MAKIDPSRFRSTDQPDEPNSFASFVLFSLGIQSDATSSHAYTSVETLDPIARIKPSLDKANDLRGQINLMESLYLKCLVLIACPNLIHSGAFHW
mmetsp:Transcript_21456/g.43900  ORF Transcript_21456/g.43900 Transcript_21456/m.43900 type:complete len:95 (+) Transcript_21456:1256-1540(+)